MPKQRSIMPEQPVLGGPPVQLPDVGQPNVVDSFVAGLIGEQLPGDLSSALGATVSMGLLGKIAKMLGKRTPPRNLGDSALAGRTDWAELPPEFTPVGAEDLYNAGKPKPVAKNPKEAVYQNMLVNKTRRRTPKK